MLRGTFVGKLKSSISSFSLLKTLFDEVNNFEHSDSAFLLSEYAVITNLFVFSFIPLYIYHSEGDGLIPAGAYKNKEFREAMVDISPSVKQAVLDIMYDPQTSGGLLICVERESAGDLLNELKEKGISNCAVIGEVLSVPKGKIVVT